MLHCQRSILQGRKVDILKTFRCTLLVECAVMLQHLTGCLILSLCRPCLRQVSSQNCHIALMLCVNVTCSPKPAMPYWICCWLAGLAFSGTAPGKCACVYQHTPANCQFDSLVGIIFEDTHKRICAGKYCHVSAFILFNWLALFVLFLSCKFV